MSALKSIVGEFVHPVGGAAVVLGEQVDAATAAALEGRLAALRRRQLEVYFLACVGMIVLLFLVEVGIILTQFNKPDLVKVAVATFGVSTFGLITQLVRLWRDRDRTGTILALAQALEPADLRAVLHVMMERQFGRSAAAGRRESTGGASTGAGRSIAG